MKTLLINVLVILGFAGTLSAADWQAPESSVTELVEHLDEHIPAGWKVSYDELGSDVSVERLQTVLGVKISMNGPIEEPRKYYPYKIIFHIMPFVTQSAFASLREENEATQKKIDAVETELRHSPTARFIIQDYFISDNADDKKKIAELDRLIRSRHSLPDYSYGNLSLQKDDPEIEPVTQIVANECYEAYKAVTNSLTKY